MDVWQPAVVQADGIDAAAALRFAEEDALVLLFDANADGDHLGVSERRAYQIAGQHGGS